VTGDLTFVHAARVHLVWLAVLLGAVLAYLELRGKDALGRFLSSSMQDRLAYRPSVARRAARVVLVVLVGVAGVLALMRPQTRGATETVTQTLPAADIMVVLDVSRSMLAEDAAPNRLARAKAEVTDLLGKLSGHRVGLVAFAGRAVVLCPLTPDYGFFRTVLRGVDTKAVGRGGTRVGDAIRKAQEAFPAGEGAKLVLLITDGEDHDSYPEDAAKKAAEAGIRIVSIGFGSEQGSPVTLTDPQTGAKTPLTDRSGQVVTSRLDGETLRKVALATEGAYVPAGVAALDLESIVTAHIKPLVRATAESSVRVVPAEHYPWPVMAALAFLMGAVWVGSQSRRRRT
jgi:Ca-activated chloride channel family protein